jgi:hypothetical protein
MTLRLMRQQALSPCLFISAGLRPANHLQVEYGSTLHFVGLRKPSALYSRDLSGWPQLGTNPNFRVAGKPPQNHLPEPSMSAKSCSQQLAIQAAKYPNLERRNRSCRRSRSYGHASLRSHPGSGWRGGSASACGHSLASTITQRLTSYRACANSATTAASLSSIWFQPSN